MEKGKCYSKCDRGQRKKSDLYQTPHIFTQLLLDNEYFDPEYMIYEPCAGHGAITKVLVDNEYSVIDDDIEYKGGNDFLTFNAPDDFAYLITNPPYSLANEFIMKSKEIIREKFAMLLPLNYLQGQWRYENIYQDKEFPLKKILILSRMPMLSDTLRSDGKFATGMQSYGWFIWDRFYKGDPKLDWLDIQPYVASKKDVI